MSWGAYIGARGDLYHGGLIIEARGGLYSELEGDYILGGL